MQTEDWASVFREAVIAISREPYDYRGPHNQSVFPLLDRGAEAIRHFVPFHYLVRVSHGIGARPRGLWIAVLDPDVTETATKGVYVVYLFDEDRKYMYLSLNQGVTEAKRQARRAAMHVGDLLRLEAVGVRTLLADRSSDLDHEIRLGSSTLLRGYEAGNIVSKRYELGRLEARHSLVDDLVRFLDLYAIAVVDAEWALAAGRSEITLPPRTVDYNRPPAAVRFEPKDASDYRAHINAQEQVRSRSHERLVASLAGWTSARGFTPNNNVHPRDLVLHRAGMPDVLVEVKVFPAGRPREGVRTAIGQLFEYQRFYHLGHPDTRRLVALSEYPGGCLLRTT